MGLTIRRLEADGWVVEKTEYHLRHGRGGKGITRDLLGFIDCLALRPGIILGVQVTSSSNVSARVKKIQESEFAVPWVMAGGMLEVHGWGEYRGEVEARRVRFLLKRGSLVTREMKRLEEAR